MNRTKQKLAVAVLLTVAAAGITAVAQASSSDQPPWVGDQGQTLPDKLPPLIKLSTDLTKEGFVWVDTNLLKEPGKNGPFDAFLPNDQKTVAFWYYAGAGLFAVGTTEDVAYKFAPPATTGPPEVSVPVVDSLKTNG